ncbi:MAG: YtoQ family protein [Candidatus Latescibacteria bacterium]|jgi:YtoQ family protein|nr:YtoQ family protein [Candidatus Latescibacterota bacterium]
MSQSLLVYLAGHIHGDWRERVRQMSEKKGLDITFKGPCENHGLSDDIGVQIRGITESDVGSGHFPNVKDDLGGRVNNLRTQVWISRCDVLIAFFDEEHKNYRQWNTSSDIAEAKQYNKPVIVVHGPGFRHSLKELDGRADVVVDSLEQAVEVLSYVCGD